MGKYACKICKDKTVARVVQEEHTKGMTAAGIAKLMTLRGFEVASQTMSTHIRQHLPPTPMVPPGALPRKDLAILVRDMTYDAVTEGKLDVLSENWGNVNPGLRAQDTIDRRASKTDDRQTAMAMAMLLAGGATGFLAPATLRVEDGLTIEGEYTDADDAVANTAD